MQATFATSLFAHLRRWTSRLVAVIGLPAAALALAALSWVRIVAPADASAHAGLDSNPEVAVTRGDFLVFRPRGDDVDTGVIFYPGAKADPVAYAPLLHRIAATGALVVLVPMPLNLAILAPDRALGVIARYPQVRRWIVGGHSLGGVAAAMFAARHRQAVAGVMFWAAYPPSFASLRNSGLPVLSVYGSADDLARPATIEAARNLLPPDARMQRLEGADHWNFGDFAPGRGTALVSRDQQQTDVVAAVAVFLRGLPHPSASATAAATP